MHHSIEIEQLSFSYPDGHPALDRVSLKIAPCEKVALVGPNGAGKSTLILHLNGILQGEGSVQVCSLPVDKSNLGRIRGMVGLVFQNPDDQLFSPTVYDDVAFGPLYQGLAEAEVRARVEAALAAVQMEGYAGRVFHIWFGEALDPRVPLIRGTGDGERIKGTAFADNIDARGGDDRLLGLGGADTLAGGAGNDTLLGGAGADRLRGGLGSDEMFGGSGADIFQFRAVAESPAGAARDVVRDFTPGTDRIDLRFDADETMRGTQDFDFIGRAPFSHEAGELRYARGVLSADTDGDGIADFEVRLVDVPRIEAHDLIL